MLIKLFFCFFVVFSSFVNASSKVINDVKVINTFLTSPFGINMNYLRDHDANRIGTYIPLIDALHASRANWMRYPGGEMADFFRFSLPPYEENSAYSTRKYYQKYVNNNEIYELDDYLALLNNSDVEGYVVLPIEEAILDPNRESEIIDHAKAWLTYAKKHSVKKIMYWELGNENWKHKNKLDRISELVSKISYQLKLIEPDIKVGTSVENEKWARVLSEPKYNLDFISMSNYANFNQGYNEYLKASPGRLIGKASKINKVLKNKNIELVVAEYNTASWQGDWKSGDFGHAIVLFNLSLELLKLEQLSKMAVWSTRWMNDNNEDTHRDLLRNDNSLSIAGAIFSLLANNFLNNQHPTLYWDDSVFIYPMSDDRGINLFLLNKSNIDKQLDLTFKSKRLCAPQSTSLFVETGGLDNKAEYNTLYSNIYEKKKILTMTLQGYSINLIKC